MSLSLRTLETKSEEPMIKSILLPNICGLDRLNIYKE